MEQYLRLLDALKTHLNQMHTELGADWPAFVAEIKGLAPAFKTDRDEITLAQAVEKLFLACLAREPVLAILRSTADAGSIGFDRRPPAGGTGTEDTQLVREIVNHFQSLLTSLEEIEQPGKGDDRHSERTNPSGAEDANDHGTHA
jgi:hypothetical protein